MSIHHCESAKSYTKTLRYLAIFCRSGYEQNERHSEKILCTPEVVVVLTTTIIIIVIVILIIKFRYRVPIPLRVFTFQELYFLWLSYRYSSTQLML
jgi:uncharacterized membrane protein YhdT